MKLPPRLRVPLAAGVSFLVLTTSACGGDSKDSKDSKGAAKKPAGQTSAPVGEKTAEQLAEESRAALRAAKSVRVQGIVPDGAKGAKLDVIIAGDSAKGTVDLAIKGAATPVEVVKVKGKLYLKGKEFWVKGASKAAGATVGDNWVAAPAHLAKTFDPFLTTAGLSELLSPAEGALTKGPPSKINGRPVIPLKDDAGLPVYVAAEGTPRLVRMFDGAKALNFTYDVPAEFKAPRGAIDLSGRG